MSPSTLANNMQILWFFQKLNNYGRPGVLVKLLSRKHYFIWSSQSLPDSTSPFAGLSNFQTSSICLVHDFGGRMYIYHVSAPDLKYAAETSTEETEKCKSVATERRNLMEKELAIG